MNPEQYRATARHLLSLVLGYLAGKGYIPVADVVDITSALLAIGGGIVALAPMVWAIISRNKVNTIAAAAAIPTVEKIVDPTVASSPALIANPKVTAH